MPVSIATTKISAVPDSTAPSAITAKRQAPSGAKSAGSGGGHGLPGDLGRGTKPRVPGIFR